MPRKKLNAIPDLSDAYESISLGVGLTIMAGVITAINELKANDPTGVNDRILMGLSWMVMLVSFCKFYQAHPQKIGNEQQRTTSSFYFSLGAFCSALSLYYGLVDYSTQHNTASVTSAMAAIGTGVYSIGSCAMSLFADNASRTRLTRSTANEQTLRKTL